MHGGNIRKIAIEHSVDAEKLLDFSTGINPLGYPNSLRSNIDRYLHETTFYPDPEYTELKTALSDSTGIPPEHILPGAGTSQLLLAMLHAIRPPAVITAQPSYIDYCGYASRLDIPTKTILLSKQKKFRPDQKAIIQVLDSAADGSLVILCNPNNPTGHLWPDGMIEQIAAQYPKLYFCIDQAYMGFTRLNDCPTGWTGNIIRLQSMTKLYAIPGLRIGYMYGTAEILQRISGHLPVWHIGTLPARIAQTFAADREYVQMTRQYFDRVRPDFCKRLSGIDQKAQGIKVYPSDSNFVLFEITRPVSNFYSDLIQNGIVLRECSDFTGLDDRFFRTAIRLEEDNERLFGALEQVLRPHKRSAKSHKTPAIMLQGTSSNAGKSLMSVALCRILSDRGLSVAPFKAQNMSLNSYVTAEGDEIGRAQAVQAAACRISPHVLMNPVLLKPTGDMGSQIIVLGQASQTMSAKAYYEKKTHLKTVVQDAYNQLAQQHDVVVLEGAGSPGEINLRKHDIVNMEMAGHAGSPVLMVGDIDRGGVYASFVGHMGVMAEWERQLVKGFLINKFRGDRDLLKDAHVYIQQRTGKSIIGVMPWVNEHFIPEEDSLSFDEIYGKSSGSGHIVIGFVGLPRTSNFTDLDPLRKMPDIRLVKIDSEISLNQYQPAAVIIPGSKNVIEDYAHIESRGLASALHKAASNKKIVLMGICGGFQMLGTSITDPDGLENSPGTRKNTLGLLNIHTTLMPQKTLRQIQTTLKSDKSPVKGYEIHHGQSSCDEEELFETPGLGYHNGNIWGTYLHGIFDNPGFTQRFLEHVRQNSGLTAGIRSDPSGKTLDQAIDDFARVFKENVDVNGIFKLMDLRL